MLTQLLLAYILGIPIGIPVFACTLWQRAYKQGLYHIEAARYGRELARRPIHLDGIDVLLCNPKYRFAEEVAMLSITWPVAAALSLVLLLRRAAATARR